MPLRSTLAALSDGDWHVMRVRLECFLAAGLDITSVNTPFLIHADGPLAPPPWTAGMAPSCSSYEQIPVV